ncbi:hypothetical protein J5N97_001389 [Dioscorea zingiberensis]|uniref:Uncharacterized protein n=1 Tax=Dioscorea zingiberensis TaxID=325984 RepID=A0A9D5BUF4_9LILI|nr:hypothetical protein J5N97_001389 [Dioscorea zingiberensis]
MEKRKMEDREKASPNLGFEVYLVAPKLLKDGNSDAAWMAYPTANHCCCSTGQWTIHRRRVFFPSSFWNTENELHFAAFSAAAVCEAHLSVYDLAFGMLFMATERTCLAVGSSAVDATHLAYVIIEKNLNAFEMVMDMGVALELDVDWKLEGFVSREKLEKSIERKSFKRNTLGFYNFQVMQLGWPTLLPITVAVLLVNG